MAYRKIEQYDESTTQEIAGHIKSILELLGEDTSREGLIKTPERVAKAMQFLTQGYQQDGKAIVQSALFDEPYNHMVIVKDIELFSLCASAARIPLPATTFLHMPAMVGIAV